MPFYHKLGKIPSKRHTQFRKPDGTLFQEQLFSTEGFSSVYSILYHHYPPTVIAKAGDPVDVSPRVALPKQMKPRCFKGFLALPAEDYLKSRTPLMVNSDCIISVAAPQKSMTDYFFKNADADEIIFIHEGNGTLKTMYGNIDFEYGDYLIIPRGTIYQMHFNQSGNRLLITESFSPVETPNRYRNEHGQLLEHSPYCERDIKSPQVLETHDERGEFLIYIKKQSMMYPYLYSFHPFDVVGWDGYNYPYGFSIHNFEPITGRVHQPPPVHQTFQTRGFVVCSFVPRMYDYHPLSIPAPYHHSNIDSDELLYYVDGDFMSRNNIQKGQITLHPGGIPHGPHPGAIERSIGKKSTEELAVMIDPFQPVQITEEALKIDVKDYYKSWLEELEMSNN